MSWLHAHFSAEYALHAIFSFDETTGGQDLTLAHGYLLRDGAVLGLASGTGKTVRDSDFFAETLELEVTDGNGGTHTFIGTGTTKFPWQPWPNMVGFNVLARWSAGDPAVRDLVGWGEIQDFVDLTRLTALNSHNRVTASVQR